MKAWIDLLDRKENGEQIDSGDVKKHKNDIFRLLFNISPSSRVSVGDEIHEDIIRFLDRISGEKVELKNLGIRTVSFDELLDRIKKLFS